jgi:hypothetical protein
MEFVLIVLQLQTIMELLLMELPVNVYHLTNGNGIHILKLEHVYAIHLSQ